MTSHELYRNEGQNFRSVRVDIDEERIRIDTHDMGSLTEEFFGDPDYEFWTIVPKSAWGDLLLAFAKEFLDGDQNATRRLQEMCEKHGVTHDCGRWA